MFSQVPHIGGAPRGGQVYNSSCMQKMLVDIARFVPFLNQNCHIPNRSEHHPAK